MLSALPLLLLCLIFALIRAQDNNQTRAICYSGSSLYQLTTQNCNEQDSSYIGVWYCAKMEVRRCSLALARRADPSGRLQ